MNTTEKNVKVETKTRIELEGRKQLLLLETTTVLAQETTTKTNRYGQMKKSIQNEVVIDSHEKVLEKYKLYPVTIEELKEIRKYPDPIFILKDGDNFYYAIIDSKLHLAKYNIFGKDYEHICAPSNGKLCKRFSPMPESKGGCSKVWNKPEIIERYPFIKLGYETINTDNNILCVCQCDNYIKPPEEPAKKKVSKEQLIQAKITLAQYIWPDVETLNDIREKRNPFNK